MRLLVYMMLQYGICIRSRTIGREWNQHSDLKPACKQQKSFIITTTQFGITLTVWIPGTCVLGHASRNDTTSASCFYP